MAGPFFIPDLSAWQGPLPNFNAIAAAPNHIGCIIKATQGVGPGVSQGHSPQWFGLNWPRVREAGSSRFGQTWFRGCYCYAEPTPSGTAQADYLLRTVDLAGGWGDGDMPPAWDLEGSRWISRQQIVDVSSQFAERIKQQLGRAPILYTGSTWRKFGVKESAGFKNLWTTHMDLMVPFGWPTESVILHQYIGTGKYYNPSSQPAKLGYPKGVPGLASSVDMNVVMDGGFPATSIDRVRALLTGRGAPAREALARDAPARQATTRAAPTRGGISMPIVIGVGTGLLALGIMISSVGRDEPV
jgi:GH25 family lysozyme M1 (1,4-beta-N-acetylmuramidase)